MTRIVAGTCAGRRLAVPAQGTRPTSDRVREALFSRLEHLGALVDARVADLYAGSGALGLEAASRGAARVVLVESDAAAVRICRSNVESLGLGAQVEVVPLRVERYLAGAPGPFDLMLADPPYALSGQDLSGVLASLVAALAPDGLVVVERSVHDHPVDWPDGLEPDDDRRYGQTRLSTARRRP